MRSFKHRLCRLLLAKQLGNEITFNESKYFWLGNLFIFPNYTNVGQDRYAIAAITGWDVTDILDWEGDCFGDEFLDMSEEQLKEYISNMEEYEDD